ncbi:chloride channel protein [Sphingomonas mali]|uniref:chloride channel protein n=1 Tax=Sphingomonas mali TaxID=40682 RepID=UPI000831D621|nr:chloride channel protein [Sphingomonas mali]
MPAPAGTPLRLPKLRALVRTKEILLLPLALLIGVATGTAVVAMSLAAQAAHAVLYGIPLDVRLSASAAVDPVAAMAGPAVGGLLLGLMEYCRQRWKLSPVVDPVEANALRGGKLSLRDSLIVSGQTLVSNGAGASVGLEAGYTQIGAGFASWLGTRLNLRRNDLRLMVGCGTAAAISAAFNAPLTGTFYACELIIGTYSVASAVPILAAALSASFVAGHLGGHPYSIDATTLNGDALAQLPALLILALIAGLFGIAMMRAVARCENLLDRLALPFWCRPLAGGLLVGALAMVTPQVLAAGHGAMILDLGQKMGASLIVTIIVLKAMACILSLASGFRGGLFFASLFLGALLGKWFALQVGATPLATSLPLDPQTSAFAGMAALGVAIVGGPLTMTFLVLEITRSFAVTATSLIVSVITSAFVRSIFGHSFSTWRLHLRGESIRGAEDIGWIRSLSVGAMMRTDVALGDGSTTVAACRASFRLGSTPAIFLTDRQDRYIGTLLMPDLFSPDLDARAHATEVATLSRYATIFLRAEMNVKTAMQCFENAEADILPVLDAAGEVIGFLNEAYARRRYMQTFDQARASVTALA